MAIPIWHTGIAMVHLRIRGGVATCEEMSAGEVGGAVNGWEGDRWRREVESRSTLQLYRHKIGIGDEGI